MANHELQGQGHRVIRTPQSEQADPRQVENNAGGFTFKLDQFDALLRFLILGTAGGTYYANQKDHTKQAIDTVDRCLAADGKRAVELAVEVSKAGRAPKNDQAIFVLARAAASDNIEVRKAAYDTIGEICRTATHLFTFLAFVQEHRGWSRGLRSAVARWYNDREVDDIAYQLVKYRQRNGWTHRDALRLAHPKFKSDDYGLLWDWTCGREVEAGKLPSVVQGYQLAQAPAADIPGLIREYRLPWEALPTGINKDSWLALLDAGALPLGALIRQLPTLTRAGVFDDANRTREVVGLLGSTEALSRARIHPYNVLVAQRTYAMGRSLRGENTWKPVTGIIDALDDAFYKSFGNVEPMGGRTLIALDISGSMGIAIGGGPITAREGSAAMALVTMATEQVGDVEVIGYTCGPNTVPVNSKGRGGGWRGHGVGVELVNISPRQRLDDVQRTLAQLPMGGTDCAMPFLWAMGEGKIFDRVISYTDNETWAGDIHPHQALRDYRKIVPQARLVAVGMTATEYTVGDPNDAGTLNVAGFDAAAPGLISAFARGEI